MAKLTHKQLVLNCLMNGEHVTAPRLWGLYGITRLSAHIYSLRNEGYLIINTPSDIYKGYDNYSLDVESAKRDEALAVEAGIFEDIREVYDQIISDDVGNCVTLTSQFLYEKAGELFLYEVSNQKGV